MKKVKINYKQDPYAIRITCDNKSFNTSRIKDLKISEWAFPFLKADVEWKGLYDELKDFTGEEAFTVQFDGDKEDFETLKFALDKTKAKLISSNNVAVILYSEEPYSTKINVNGEVYDTARIQNRSIEEWIKPIELRGMEWKGIFKELEEFIGTDEYNIQFMGDQELMKPLLDECPSGVNVTYRMPVRQSKAPEAGTASSGADKAILEGETAKASGTAAGVGQAAKREFSEAAGLVKGKIKEEVTDEEIEKNLENIPIKNKVVRQHLMAICAGIIYLFMLFPFATYTVGGGEELGGMAGATGNAYEALGGLHSKASLLGQHAAIPGWQTPFAIALIVIPGIIIAMNYINALKPYRRIIAIIGPAAGIAFAIITVIALHAAYYSASGAPSSIKVSTMVGPGFILMIIMYVITAIVGLITYYGYKLPTKNK